MRDFISFNLRILPAADASVPLLSSAALYGKGIFTTIAIYDCNPFLWKKHWRRLADNAAKLEIDLSDFSEGRTKQALEEIIRQNDVISGRARVTFFDESASDIWHFGGERKTSLLITTADFRPVPENFRITISPHRVLSLSQLASIKSCNYLDNIMAIEDANAKGLDEAIRLNERGEITSVCLANVFWLKDEKLHTPSLKTGCLAGTTRELILETLECEEVEENVENLHLAAAIFLSSAGLGVIQVRELQGKVLPTVDHPITQLIPKRR